MEYLVTMTPHVPPGTPDKTVDDVRAREAAHTRELAAQGHVLRLWRPPLAPGEWRTRAVRRGRRGRSRAGARFDAAPHLAPR
jgi:muconolactone delta-isomerase